jgi:hypothetical protein
LPIGLFTDLLAAWNSMARIEAKAQGRRDRILPARDKRVFQHRSYPPPA